MTGDMLKAVCDWFTNISIKKDAAIIWLKYRRRYNTISISAIWIISLKWSTIDKNLCLFYSTNFRAWVRDKATCVLVTVVFTSDNIQVKTTTWSSHKSSTPLYLWQGSIQNQLEEISLLIVSLYKMLNIDKIDGNCRWQLGSIFR